MSRASNHKNTVKSDNTKVRPRHGIHIELAESIEGIALYADLNDMRASELKSWKQYMLMCVAEHLSYNNPILSQRINDYLFNMRKRG